MRPIVGSGTTSPILVIARVSGAFEAVGQFHPPASAENAVIDWARFEMLLHNWIAAVYGESDPEK